MLVMSWRLVGGDIMCTRVAACTEEQSCKSLLALEELASPKEVVIIMMIHVP